MCLGEPVAPSRRRVFASPCLKLSERGCRRSSPTAEVHAQAGQVPVCIHSAEALCHQVRWVRQSRKLEELKVFLFDLVLELKVANVQVPELAKPGSPDDAYGRTGIRVHSGTH